MLFYTYLWLREDGTPYYVGKGHGNRAFVLHRRSQLKPPTDKNLVLIQEFPDENSSLAAEKFLIELYGRKDIGTGCLRNLTNGGDGISGYKHTEDAKRKIHTSLKGNSRSTGYVHGEDFREKRKKSMLGKKYALGFKQTDITRQNMSKAHMGHTVSEETRRKISAGHKRRTKE